MQVKQLMKHCVTQLKLCLRLETFAETAIVADKMNHEGLQQACVEFALQEEHRWALKHAFLSQFIWHLTLHEAGCWASALLWGNPSLEA